MWCKIFEFTATRTQSWLKSWSPGNHQLFLAPIPYKTDALLLLDIIILCTKSYFLKLLSWYKIFEFTATRTRSWSPGNHQQFLSPIPYKTGALLLLDIIILCTKSYFVKLLTWYKIFEFTATRTQSWLKSCSPRNHQLFLAPIPFKTDTILLIDVIILS